jgi:hypothetical protein
VQAATLPQSSLPAALDYSELLGWALIPLRPRDKRPHGELLTALYGSPAWKPFAHRPATPVEIRAWYEYDPELNLGVICGRDGLIVADFDTGIPRHDFVTPTAATHRGAHLYFRSDRKVHTTKTEFGELRGEGSYVVVPYSVHPSGSGYSWVIPPPPCSEYASLSDLESLLSSPLQPRNTYALVEEGDESSAWSDIGRREEHVARVLTDVFEVSVPTIRQGFLCCLPGPRHNERRPSASLYELPDGTWAYRDWHVRSHVEWLSLIDVYASRVNGRVVTITGSPAQARWWMRLAHDIGLVEPVPVELRLPRDATVTMRRVAAGFELLLGLRWVAEPGEPAPFTRRAAALWCGITEDAAMKAIDALLTAGVLRVVDWHKASYGKRMPLFLPGSGIRR